MIFSFFESRAPSSKLKFLHSIHDDIVLQNAPIKWQLNCCTKGLVKIECLAESGSAAASFYYSIVLLEAEFGRIFHMHSKGTLTVCIYHHH